MEVDYIIVQAGGKGTRLEYLTRNKPKALVPINNLPILFYLFKKYPNKKYIIISDYKIDVMRRYLEVFSDVQYIIVDASGKTGTCAGLQQSLRLLPDKESFLLIWSDLILPENFELPKTNGNYIGISKGFRCRWRYKNDIFEEVPSYDYGVAGVFIFSEKKILGDVPFEGELVKWMKSKGFVFQTIGLNQTKEYGLLAEIEQSKSEKGFLRCRPFNSLIMKEKSIIKEGIDKQGKMLAEREKAWYKLIQELGYQHIPNIISYEPLEMQFISGGNIYDYDLSYNEKKNILFKIISSLKELHNLRSISTDYFSVYDAYVGKTLRRLDKIRDLVPHANERYIIVNEKKCRNIFFYRDRLIQIFENYCCSEFVLLHGDCTFSNILLNSSKEPIFIDPRGYFGYTDNYGDPLYDWAKLYYSIVGNYDQFNQKHFELSINEEKVDLHIESNGWEDVEDYFLELLAEEVDIKYLKLIHSIIWLSLTTYAWEDYDSICAAFYNGLYFLEDIL